MHFSVKIKKIIIGCLLPVNIVFVFSLSFSGCFNNKYQQLEGKWKLSSEGRVKDIPVFNKGICEFNSDNTFVLTDSLNSVNEEDYLEIGKFNNSYNDIIIKVSGTWKIDGDFIIYKPEKSNIGFDIGQMTFKEKIVRLDQDVFITENERGKTTTYQRLNAANPR